MTDQPAQTTSSVDEVIADIDTDLLDDELFVLVLARRLGRLTTTEQQRLKSTDLQRLASVGLIGCRGTNESGDLRPCLYAHLG